jgi:hypothetical protein
LTGTNEGIQVIISNTELLRSITLLTIDPSQAIAKDAALTLLNLSADALGKQSDKSFFFFVIMFLKKLKPIHFRF